MKNACNHCARNGGDSALSKVQGGLCGLRSRRKRLVLVPTFLVLTLSLLVLMLRGWNPSSSVLVIRSEAATRAPTGIFSEVDCVDQCCDVPLRMNRSCWYRNLYFRNGQFFYIPHPHRSQFSDKAPPELSVFMGDRVQFEPPWHPVIVSIPAAGDVGGLPYGNASTLALHSWNASVEHVSGTFVLCLGVCLWENWAHSLLDGALSSFAALLKFDDLHGRTFGLILSEHSRAPHVTAAVSSVLGTAAWDASNYVSDRWYRFENAVVGRGNMGFSSYDSDLVSMARRQDAISLFRKRFVDHYCADPSLTPSNKSRLPCPAPSVPPACKTNQLFVAFVRTKRPVTNTDDELERWIRQSLPEFAVRVEFIRWEQFGNNLGDQIRFLQQVDIYISGVGTGICNMVFLRPGSVVVNLGYPMTGGTTGYLEEFLAPALDWLRVLYYPRYLKWEINSESPPSVHLDQQKFEGVVRSAAKLVCEGFPLPVSPPSLNLSPVGHAARYAFELMPELHLYVDVLLRQLPHGGHCHAFPEEMLFDTALSIGNWGPQCPQVVGGDRQRYLEVLNRTADRFPDIFGPAPIEWSASGA